MSKKHKKFNQGGTIAAQGAGSHDGEYGIIQHDLIKVLILNALYLAGVLALYFTNQKSHYLEAWFSKVLHF